MCVLVRVVNTAGEMAHDGVWRSLVARFVRDEEAVGSNPATPTLALARAPPRVRAKTRSGHAMAAVLGGWPAVRKQWILPS